MNIFTEITVKVEQSIIVRPKAKTLCPHCESEMVSPNQAARLIGCKSRAIFGWIEFGWLHFTKTNRGLLKVCRQSLGEIINLN